LTLRRFERVQHFGQIWAKRVASNISRFLFGDLAQVCNFPRHIANSGAKNTTARFKSCAF